MPTPESVSQTLDAVVRSDWGRILSVLIGELRDFQLAEECLQDALNRALVHWRRGIPQSPRAWILQVARRRAIDQIRRNRRWREYVPELTHLMDLDARDGLEVHEISDERLRLIFTACHPAIDQKTRIALTLRTLCGLTTGEIARAFLDSETAMAQRLVRARNKIAKARIPYAVPDRDDWDARLNSVLTVIYLIFNEGYATSRGDQPIRNDLCEEAIRLVRAVDTLRPNTPEIIGLLSLLLLNHARSAARQNDEGVSVPLDEQDRSLWNSQMIGEGLVLIEKALRRGQVGPFQLQAAISAIHSEAPSADATDWTEITMIYDRLMEISDNPVIALNRAVAVSFAVDAAAGLRVLPDGLEGYQSFHAARADMYRRNGDLDAARYDYQQAVALTRSDPDRLFLQKRLLEL